MDEAGLDIASIRRLSRFELQLSDAGAGLSQGCRTRESSSWLSIKLPIEEQRQCAGDRCNRQSAQLLIFLSAGGVTWRLKWGPR